MSALWDSRWAGSRNQADVWENKNDCQLGRGSYHGNGLLFVGGVKMNTYEDAHAEIERLKVKFIEDVRAQLKRMAWGDMKDDERGLKREIIAHINLMKNIIIA